MRTILLIEFIILGIIQGLLEPLPISSSGHIFIIRHLFNIHILNDLNFEIIVNAGSLLAVLIIYKNDLINLLKRSYYFLFKHDDMYYDEFIYLINIVIGIIPIMICGLLFKSIIESSLIDLNIVGAGFLITSILLFVSRNKLNNKSHKLKFRESFKIGLFSTIALLPGISRCASSLVAGLNNNLNRKDALRFSFMMYIPISIGTIILGLNDLMASNTLKYLWIPYFIAFIFSFFTSLFSLKWFINKINSKTLLYFSIYCLLLGLFILII